MKPTHQGPQENQGEVHAQRKSYSPQPQFYQLLDQYQPLHTVTNSQTQTTVHSTTMAKQTREEKQKKEK